MKKKSKVDTPIKGAWFQTVNDPIPERLKPFHSTFIEADKLLKIQREK